MSVAKAQWSVEREDFGVSSVERVERNGPTTEDWPPIEECTGCARPARLGRMVHKSVYPVKSAPAEAARRMAACNGCEHLFHHASGWLICAINQRQVEQVVHVESASCPKGKWIK